MKYLKKHLTQANKDIPARVGNAQHRLNNELDTGLDIVPEHGATRVGDQVECVDGPDLHDRRAGVLRKREEY